MAELKLTGTITKEKSLAGSINKGIGMGELPSKLPNPYALTINGTSYDGSEAVDLTIKGGSGEDVWEEIINFTLNEDVSNFTLETDINGNAFSLKEFTAFVVHTPIAGNTEATRTAMKINSDRAGWGGSGESVEISKSPVETGENLYSFVHITTLDGYVWKDKIRKSSNATTTRELLVSPNVTAYDQSARLSVDKTTNELKTCKMPCTRIDFTGLGKVNFGAGTQVIVRGVRA